MKTKTPNSPAFPVYIHACAMNSALGDTQQESIKRLALGFSPDMCLESGWLNDGGKTVVGKVVSPLPEIDVDLTDKNTRNNRLALSALVQIKPQIEQAVSQYGAERIAVIVGTSTSGIADGETALAEKQKTGQLPEGYHYHQQEVGNLGEFVADYFKIDGPVYTISTACSSSGRVFLSAKRLLKAGIVDAVLVGGSDSLCKLTLNGFHGLEALSNELCSPFSKNRHGINIGEAAAFMLLSREKNSSGLALLGAGDSSDAHHISAPHPEGKGAAEAMHKALNDAQLRTDQIGYINAHGTATKLNDAMEAKAIYALFSDKVAVSSTKPLTGHALGAASILEAALCWLLLEENLDLPVQINDGVYDPSLAPIRFVQDKEKLQKRAVLSNSFAFGGNNISLIFGYADE
ncbi:beta-ketoacyl-[acyl-carrier-protein] synthase family protein [Psychromonas ossibalaenae]|uniref:beta-ketoacyl-[acyl-carrier-protein] synthase family protein n=1 Tax=Psychromonas ossibalaenae TaxID=444922 RepID=UPI000367323F|nr:beta-ketoacyl-[acyl-carrier-protein] synthase family protein [Psychromonas ossibalaenae]